MNRASLSVYRVRERCNDLSRVWNSSRVTLVARRGRRETGTGRTLHAREGDRSSGENFDGRMGGTRGHYDISIGPGRLREFLRGDSRLPVLSSSSSTKLSRSYLKNPASTVARLIVYFPRPTTRRAVGVAVALVPPAIRSTTEGCRDINNGVPFSLIVIPFFFRPHPRRNGPRKGGRNVVSRVEHVREESRRSSLFRTPDSRHRRERSGDARESDTRGQEKDEEEERTP